MELALNQPAPLLKRLSWFDWLFAAIAAAGGLLAVSGFGDYMDLHEKAILLAAIPSLALFGWFWKPSRPLFVVVSAAVGFILSYTFDRGAHEIQPLVPTLKSWWMRLHVPANFVGYSAFTIATILGAMWAAEAWGGYWSWDPKGTWALVVWLNYAAWLHIRLVRGPRGPMLAWWAVVGLLLTTFAFIGVNMFLSGLHSYGAL